MIDCKKTILLYSEQLGESVEIKKDRTKTDRTKTREEAQRREEPTFFEEYKRVIKKITVPSREEWGSTLWRVSLILLIFGGVLFAVDSLLLGGVLKLQVSLPILGVGWVEGLYIALLFLVGVIATVSILATTGGSEGGLSSMLGSGVQYGDTTGEFGSKVSMTTFVSSGVLLVMILFAPIFLGGL